MKGVGGCKAGWGVGNRPWVRGTEGKVKVKGDIGREGQWGGEGTGLGMVNKVYAGRQYEW